MVKFQDIFMGKGIHFYPDPAARLRAYYPILHIISFLFLLIGSIFLTVVVKKIYNNHENTSLLTAAYFGFTLLALISSSISITARTGARWKHISHYTVVLPISGMLIPAVGTIICIYCLRKISKPTLPQLTLSYTGKRGGTHPPHMNPKIYHPVPLHGSSLSGVCALSLIILSHILFIAYSIVLSFGIRP